MSETLEFVVLGSRGDAYVVTAVRDGPAIAIACSCRAGEMNQLCRHRLSLLDGDVSDLDSGNEADVETLRRWLPGTQTGVAVDALATAESTFEAAKRELAARKKALARVLRG